jgi:hypothetical protein
MSSPIKESRQKANDTLAMSIELIPCIEQVQSTRKSHFHMWAGSLITVCEANRISLKTTAIFLRRLGVLLSSLGNILSPKGYPAVSIDTSTR